ncbi:hypothetical protein C2G38_2157288 [Gigaspora rosea]|uniref:Galactose oxidase n=1 Tax=Gigaspora rosea TaxID=44941 RepID=A0A397WAJ1_9GLOM|nr:hypothetical protein C2G38_2157288 [Gigaspora rosea]
MNSFRTLLYSLIVISLTLTNVKCYIPDPRTGQASVLVGSNLYFFGGTRNAKYNDQVLYLNLSSSFNTLSPPWSQITTSPIPTPLDSPFPCLSTDGSTIYLVGGMSQDHSNSSILMLPSSYTYAFNTNSLQWATPNISNFNIAFLGREEINGVADSNGKCYFFGGYLTNITTTSPTVAYNDTNIFDTKAMRWLTLTTLSNTPSSRIFCGVVLKNNFIYYIGGVDNRNEIDMKTIPSFDTVDLKWLYMSASGDSVGTRYGHSAVLTQDGLILIYGGLGRSSSQALPDMATLDVSVTPYVWKAIATNNAPPQPLVFHSATLYRIYIIFAFGRIAPSQPLPDSTPLTSNDKLYIFNVKNYTWVNTFDVTITYGPNPTESKSISLGAKIGIGIGVIVAVGIMVVVGIFFYKKFHNRKGFRNSIATPGTQYI